MLTNPFLAWVDRSRFCHRLKDQRKVAHRYPLFQQQPHDTEKNICRHFVGDQIVQKSFVRLATYGIGQVYKLIQEPSQ